MSITLMQHAARQVQVQILNSFSGAITNLVTLRPLEVPVSAPLNGGNALRAFTTDVTLNGPSSNLISVSAGDCIRIMYLMGDQVSVSHCAAGLPNSNGGVTVAGGTTSFTTSPGSTLQIGAVHVNGISGTAIPTTSTPTSTVSPPYVVGPNWSRSDMWTQMTTTWIDPTGARTRSVADPASRAPVIGEGPNTTSATVFHNSAPLVQQTMVPTTGCGCATNTTTSNVGLGTVFTPSTTTAPVINTTSIVTPSSTTSVATTVPQTTTTGTVTAIHTMNNGTTLGAFNSTGTQTHACVQRANADGSFSLQCTPIGSNVQFLPPPTDPCGGNLSNCRNGSQPGCCSTNIGEIAGIGHTPTSIQTTCAQSGNGCLPCAPGYSPVIVGQTATATGAPRTLYICVPNA